LGKIGHDENLFYLGPRYSEGTTQLKGKVTTSTEKYSALKDNRYKRNNYQPTNKNSRQQPRLMAAVQDMAIKQHTSMPPPPRGSHKIIKQKNDREQEKRKEEEKRRKR
jgi:hypothetical protein